MTDKPPIRCVYFDVYDTLTSLREAVASDLARFEKDIAELQTYLAPHALEADEGKMSFDEYQEKYSAFFGKPLDYLPLHLLPRATAIKETHALVRILDCLGIPVGLLSDVSQQALRQTIVGGGTPYVNYFAIIESNKHGKRKSNGLIEEATKLAMERLGVDPSHILLIDDSTKNIEAAKEHGWQTYKFSPHHPRTSIKEILQTFSILS